MKAFLAAVLLLMMTACNPVMDTPAHSTSKPATGKPLPYAPPPPPMPDEGVACAADVGPCADGSTVTRNPAKSCTFDPCPGGTTQ